MSRGVGHRHGSDPALLWLWRRPAFVALIRLLAWELPYGVHAALKKRERERENVIIHDINVKCRYYILIYIAILL